VGANPHRIAAAPVDVRSGRGPTIACSPLEGNGARFRRWPLLTVVLEEALGRHARRVSGLAAAVAARQALTPVPA
jgi:hypothetical protein